MYVEKTDTYTCDFCGHNAKWDASDDVHGELWSCEAEGCGKVFCSKCFISAFGQEIYMTMMQSGENVLCPECTEIWRRLDTGGYLMRKLCNEPFARWLTCHECGASWMDGNCIRPNVTFRNGTQTETVLYDDWNGTAAYNSTFNPNFKKGE